ncbi:MAG: hypothetical protein ISF22_00980 [Methanomassiliicoccus sp.]|nr:hypothetical protein [Methanomassiliicoccus sp.]
MSKKYDEEEHDEEEQKIEDEEEEVDMEEAEPVMAEDAVIDVSFGDRDDKPEDEGRVLDWVSSFKPGEFQRQVADLFLSEGEIYIMLDKMTVVLPLVELFRLLENSGAITEPGEI